MMLTPKAIVYEHPQSKQAITFRMDDGRLRAEWPNDKASWDYNIIDTSSFVRNALASMDTLMVILDSGYILAMVYVGEPAQYHFALLEPR